MKHKRFLKFVDFINEEPVEQGFVTVFLLGLLVWALRFIEPMFNCKEANLFIIMCISAFAAKWIITDILNAIAMHIVLKEMDNK